MLRGFEKLIVVALEIPCGIRILVLGILWGLWYRAG